MSLKILRTALKGAVFRSEPSTGLLSSCTQTFVGVTKRILRTASPCVCLFPVFYGMCAMKGAVEIWYIEMGNVSYAEVSGRFNIRILQNLTII